MKNNRMVEHIAFEQSWIQFCIDVTDTFVLPNHSMYENVMMYLLNNEELRYTFKKQWDMDNHGDEENIGCM